MINFMSVWKNVSAVSKDAKIKAWFVSKNVEPSLRCSFSPYNFNTLLSRRVMRIEKIIKINLYIRTPPPKKKKQQMRRIHILSLSTFNTCPVSLDITSIPLWRAFPFSGCTQVGVRAKNCKSRGWWDKWGNTCLQTAQFWKPIHSEIGLSIRTAWSCW